MRRARPFSASLGNDLDRGEAGPLAGHDDAADRDRRIADRDESDGSRSFEHRAGDRGIVGPRVRGRARTRRPWTTPVHPGRLDGRRRGRRPARSRRAGPRARPPAGVEEAPARAPTRRPPARVGVASVRVVELDHGGQRVLERHAGIAVHGHRVGAPGEPAGRPQLPLAERLADHGRPAARGDARQLVGAERRRPAGPTGPVRHDLPGDDVGQRHPGEAAVATLDARLVLGELDQPSDHVGHGRPAARAAPADDVPHDHAAPRASRSIVMVGAFHAAGHGSGRPRGGPAVRPG